MHYCNEAYYIFLPQSSLKTGFASFLISDKKEYFAYKLIKLINDNNIKVLDKPNTESDMSKFQNLKTLTKKP